MAIGTVPAATANGAVSTAGATSIAGAFDNNNTAGNIIIVVVANRTGTASDITAPTDSNGNTYTQVQEATRTSVEYKMYYAKNIAAGANTVTAHCNTSSKLCFYAYEWAGIDISSPLDQQVSTTGNSAVPDSGATSTTTRVDELFIGAGANGTTGQGWHLGAGWTNGNSVTTAGTGSQESVAIEYLVVSSTQTADATFTLDVGSGWAAGVATFKGASAITDLNVAASDSTTISEVVTILKISLVNVSDSITTSEAIGPTLANNVSVSDTTTASEASRLLNELNIVKNDTATISESSSSLLVSLPIIFDSTTISEVIQKVLFGNLSVSDSSTLSEGLNVVENTNSYIASLSDSVSTSELVSSQLTLSLGVTDLTTVSELQTRSLTSNIGVNESTALSESSVAKAIISIATASPISGSDVRLNFTPNPSFENDPTGNGNQPAYWMYISNSGAPTYAGVANDFAVYGANSYKLAASTDVAQQIYFNLSGTVAGQTYTFSMYVKTDASVTNANLTIYDNGNSTTTSVAANNNGRVSVTRMITGGGTISFSAGLGTYGVVSHGTAWFDGALVEVGADAKPYFDSDTVGASWVGLTNYTKWLKGYATTNGYINNQESQNPLGVFNATDLGSVYLSALAAIFAVANSDITLANTVLDALQTYYSATFGVGPGGFYQAYIPSTGAIAATSDDRYLGGTAWVLLALNYYQASQASTANNNRYKTMADGIAAWIVSLQDMPSQQNHYNDGGFYSGFRGATSGTPNALINFKVNEANIDAIGALRGHATYYGGAYASNANTAQTFLLANGGGVNTGGLWDAADGHFYAGKSDSGTFPSGSPGWDSTEYLDNALWSILMVQDDTSYAQILAAVAKADSDLHLTGITPDINSQYRLAGYTDQQSINHIFTEGYAYYALYLGKQYLREVAANGYTPTAATYWQQRNAQLLAYETSSIPSTQVTGVIGPIQKSSLPSYTGETTSIGSEATLWYLLGVYNINPFDPSQGGLSQVLAPLASSFLLSGLDIPINLAASNNITATDSVALAFANLATISNNVTVNESVTILLNSLVAQSDSVTLSETVATFSDIIRASGLDNISATDTLSITLVNEPIVSDTVSTSDSAARMLNSSMSATDSMTVSDTPILNETSSIGVSDSTVISESIVALKLGIINVSDSGSLLDAPFLNLDLSVMSSETISSSEIVTPLLPVLFISASETIASSEALSCALISGLAITLSDNVVLSEVAAPLVPILPLAASDNTAILETVSTSLLLQNFSSDIVATSENSITSSVYLINVADSTTTSEIIGLLAVTSINVSDSASMADPVIMGLPISLRSSETIAVSDISSASVPTLTVSLSEQIVSVELTVVSPDTLSMHTSNIVSTSDTIDIFLEGHPQVEASIVLGSNRYDVLLRGEIKE